MKRLQQLKSEVWSAIIFMVASSLVVLLLVWSISQFSIFSRLFGSIYNGTTGAIGDTIGGITAPFVGLIGAALVYLAFKEQIKSNNLIQDELKYSNLVYQLDGLKKFEERSPDCEIVFKNVESDINAFLKHVYSNNNLLKITGQIEYRSKVAETEEELLKIHYETIDKIIFDQIGENFMLVKSIIFDLNKIKDIDQKRAYTVLFLMKVEKYICTVNAFLEYESEHIISNSSTFKALKGLKNQYIKLQDSLSTNWFN